MLCKGSLKHSMSTMWSWWVRSSIRLPSLYRNEMTVSAQRCVLSRSVKTKRDTYDLVLRLCQLQSQFHGPNTFFGNSTRRWITLFSLRRACNCQCSGIRNKMNCRATCRRFAKVTCSAIATLSTTAQAVTLSIFICAITKQWAAKIIASTALSRWMLSA